ncbi:MAG: hypothetical protein IJ007_07840 [Oscillospiraceae bacterium]|nr:hypothetical protein [Oscillospiraceae bacterium]
MTCPNCKKVYNDRVTICISCGAELVPDVCEEKTEGVFETESPVEKEEIPERNISLTRSPAAVRAVPLKDISDAGSKGGTGLPKIAVRIIASVLLFAAVLMFFFSFSLRQLTKEQNISRAVRSFDLLGLPVSEFVPEGGGATIGEAVEVMANGTGLDSAEIQSIYESSTIKDYMCGILEQYGSYLRNGDAPDTVTAETVKKLFDENISVISVWTGYVISERDRDIAYGYIDSMAPLINSFSVKSIESSFGDAVSFARAFISVPVIIAEIASAVLMVIILAVMSGSSERTLASAGTAFLSAGLVILGLVFMFTMQIGIFDFSIYAVKELIKSISYAMSDMMYTIGGVITFFGGAALVWAATLRRKEKQYRQP